MRLLPIDRLPVPGAAPAGVARASPMAARLACLLDIKNAGTLLVFDAGEYDDVTVQVRAGEITSDLSGMVLTVKHGNFSEGPFEGLVSAVTFTAAGVKVLSTASRYLAIEATTPGSAGGAQSVELGVWAKPRF